MIKRLGKALAFFFQNLFHVRLCLFKLRISITHLFGQRCDKFVEKQLVHAEFLAMTNRTANDTAQDIAPALIARQNTIHNQK